MDHSPRSTQRAFGRPFAGRLGALLAPLLALAVLPPPSALQGQEVDRFPGVSLGLTYEARYSPPIAILPFTGRFGGQEVASQVERIVSRDLRYSNRFVVMDSLPAAVIGPELDYGLWDQMNVDWILTGRVEGSGDGYILVLELHDVVFREVVDQGRFPIPSRDSDNFRMASHIASDAVVQWVFDEPGMAASRIAFSRTGSEGNQEIWMVDSDGENLQRVTNHRSLALSPAWSPDGRRVAFTSYRTGLPRIYELNLDTGEERQVSAQRSGDYMTPSYHPDGDKLIFSIVGGGRSGIYTYDVARDCCLENLTESRWEDISPRYSPDGSRVVFNSNRLGLGVPQIYTMPADGGEPRMISPFIYGQPSYFTSPEWSALGDRIAFHGRAERGQPYQILVAEMDGGMNSRVVQLTFEGRNEDPSWAPDGRHLVVEGERRTGRGLFVVDAVTGNMRQLVSGMRARLPAWSPSLAPRVQEQLRAVDH